MAIPVDICLILPSVSVLSAYSYAYHVYVWWIFTTGLVVKLLVLRHLMRLSWVKCALADLVMNAASSVTVFPGLIIWETVYYLVLSKTQGIDPDKPISWITFVLIVTMLNVVLDTWVLRFAFRRRIGKRGFALLCAANSISMGATLYGMYTYLVAHPPIA